jgi:hypothetical protein
MQWRDGQKPEGRPFWTRLLYWLGGPEVKVVQSRQDYPFRDDANNVLLLKFGKRPADSFNSEAKMVSDVLSPRCPRPLMRSPLYTRICCKTLLLGEYQLSNGR